MLFIKKLKVYGFKSFAYKTEIEFRDGITGIVGPNGCGKSNIIEALMWVFGEKSSKSIRIENIADIIFAGTEEHKPLGMAEVEVIIDNGNSLLPVEYREVSIKRRIYRSGESEFFINKQKCRLKDIHELFADTGIGKGAYSFIEQGKIDMILSTKPEERRIIFEEAAGISKYKIKRKETILKLERAENNLAQVNLFLREIKQERDKLKLQAEKAKIYREYQEKLKQLEVKFYGYRYKISIKTRNEIKEKIKKLEDKKRELNTKISQFDVKIEQLTQKLSNYTQNRFEKEKEQSKIEQIIKGNEEKMGIYRKQIEQNNLLINEKQELTKEILAENEDLTRLYQAKELKVEEITQKLSEATEQKEFLNNEIEEINKKIKDNLVLREELHKQIKEMQKILDKKRIELRGVTDAFVKEIDRKKKEVEGREDKQCNIKSEVINIIEKIEAEIENFINLLQRNMQLEEIHNKLNGIKKYIGKLKETVEEMVIHQDEFKNIIFDKDGIYAKKEVLDKEISEITNNIISNQSKINGIETENHKLIQDEKILSKKLKDIEHIISKGQFKLEQIHNEMDKIKRDIEKNNRNLESINKEIKNFSQINAQHIKTIDKLNLEIIKLTDKTDNFNKTITKIDEDIYSIRQEINQIKAKNSEILNKIYDIDLKLRDLRDIYSKTEANLQDYEDTLYNEYNVKIKEIIDSIDDNINLKELRNEIESVKIAIKNLGSVNLLAEEEYEDVDKRYNFNLQQREDLLKAKNDLIEIITETNKESTRLFLETFSKINENFHYIFRRLFGGGRANLILEDPSKPLESGIIINVQPPGKKLKSISWLSGGERSLSAIGLMFSIFLVKPSPFCALDEIDAALDDENNRRFVKMMKEFAQNTQFIIISHNPNTISNVDYLYGVSMEDKGISKIISLELRKEKIQEYVK